MARCDGSGRWAEPKMLGEDGKLHCPVCNAVVGANRHDKIKVHQTGVPTRVRTGHSQKDY